MTSAKLRLLIAGLTPHVFNSLPDGVGLKTAAIGIELGLIEPDSLFGLKTKFRLTAYGLEVRVQLDVSRLA